MNVPGELRYTRDHEWVKVEGSTATVGITDFAQGELGDIVYIEIETVGEELASEEIFGTIEAVKTVSDLFMPVAGKISVLNDAIADDPNLVNSDPYGQGWMIKIEMDDAAEFESLLTAEQYMDLVG